MASCAPIICATKPCSSRTSCINSGEAGAARTPDDSIGRAQWLPKRNAPITLASAPVVNSRAIADAFPNIAAPFSNDRLKYKREFKTLRQGNKATLRGFRSPAIFGQQPELCAQLASESYAGARKDRYDRTGLELVRPDGKVPTPNQKERKAPIGRAKEALQCELPEGLRP